MVDGRWSMALSTAAAVVSQDKSERERSGLFRNLKAQPKVDKQRNKD
jgi:hypothetical protein